MPLDGSPAKYGSYKTAGIGLRSVRGVWFKVLESSKAIEYFTGKLSLDKVAVDSTTVKAGRDARILLIDDTDLDRLLSNPI